MKIIVNRCFGGFSVSEEALRKYAERKNLVVSVVKDQFERSTVLVSSKPITSEDEWNSTQDAITKHCREQRNDPDLVAVVEELGPRANTPYSLLEVVEIPDDVEWEVGEYDGQEWIAEKHRTW